MKCDLKRLASVCLVYPVCKNSELQPILLTQDGKEENTVTM